MIRIATSEGYLLAEHREHARIAGLFASAWGNTHFPLPAAIAAMPHVITAVTRHDDAWAPRDAAPCLTREGKPSAFTRELVGAYSAFEEIDLADYLAVRGAATEAVAGDDPFAAILISMHTHNLLTEQADLATIRPEDRPLHADFVAGQLRRQQELALQLPPTLASHATPDLLRRAFEFLQLCDNLSLLVCVGYDKPRPLRHQHPDADGVLHTLTCTPLGEDTYSVSPWPFARPALEVRLPVRAVAGADCADLARFRAACAAATVQTLTIRVVAA